MIDKVNKILKVTLFKKPNGISKITRLAMVIQVTEKTKRPGNTPK